MYYSYVEIENVATSFSPARMDLALNLLRMYGPMRSTHKHSQGFVMTVFGGRCPYLHDRLLLIWQDLQDFVCDQMVVGIPFQYIAAFIVSSRRVCPGCCR